MPLLEIRNLTRSFGGLCAVSKFDLTLNGHELYGVIGPNGAGKTTIFNLISGFYRASRGNIVFNGTNTRGLKPHQVTRLGIGRTFQNIRLWPAMSVLDNLRIAQHYQLNYGLWDTFFRTRRFLNREEAILNFAMEILDSLGLSQVAREVPGNLPYGLQRRVEIARALSLKPKLLLLDEPAAGLNSSDVQNLIELVRAIHQRFNVTILLIEHQMKVVMSLCQRIKVIDFGATIAEGTPEEIQNNPLVIKAYLGDEKI
ncbi:MAG: ABC transporter ATP-binding protein [Desulfobacterales bacterium]|jgi:branched-chain amino acid transport system ATP-binding protein|nr:ABC transporter ATP-binding protein [Desulfobacterales bacterium]